MCGPLHVADFTPAFKDWEERMKNGGPSKHSDGLLMLASAFSEALGKTLNEDCSEEDRKEKISTIVRAIYSPSKIFIK